MPGGSRIANTCQHIRYRISHIHRITPSVTSSTSSRRATHRTTHAHGSKSGTDQIYAYRREAARRYDSGCAAAPYVWACAATSQSLMFLPFHSPALFLKGHAHQSEQPSPLFIGASCCHNTYFHSAHLVYLVIIDFREDQLFAQPQCIVTPAIECLW